MPKPTGSTVIKRRVEPFHEAVLKGGRHDDPLRRPRADQWDRYVRAHPQGTLFHTLGWRNAVQSAFGHEPVYLSALRGERLAGVLPMFLVPSRVAGRLLVSVPYAVGGGILADDEDTTCALFESAKRVAEQRNCASIDLRSEVAVVPDLPAVDRYVGFRRELPDDVCDVLSSLPRKARAAARNARVKHELTASFGDEHLPEVWRLYTQSMRRLGSLNYPYRLFESLIANTPRRHWVCVVKRNQRVVAGLVTFLYRDTVMPYFIGTTPEAKRYSAANFIYLCAMERGVEKGYKWFDFGRSRRDNSGSFNFKRFQGFEPRPLGYQIYTAAGHETPNLSASNPKYMLARRLWPHVPLCVTRPLGAHLAKHIPG